MSTPKPIEKMTKAELIEHFTGAGAQAQAVIDHLDSELRELKRQHEERVAADKISDEAARVERENLAGLLTAARPIAEATKAWSWPDSAIVLNRGVTFGHLKAVADAYRAAAE